MVLAPSSHQSTPIQENLDWSPNTGAFHPVVCTHVGMARDTMARTVGDGHIIFCLSGQNKVIIHEWSILEYIVRIYMYSDPLGRI